MPDPTGRGTGYARGCRCDECRQAHRARVARAISRRSATRTELGGRLVNVNAPEHGTRSTYDNWGCRCTACTASNTRASADRRDRLKREVET